jgi:hypothetical protein
LDVSKPSTRWAIFAIVVVAIVLAGVGLYASRQPAYLPSGVAADPACAYKQAHGFLCSSSEATGATSGAVTNSAFLSPDHAVWFYGAAGAVLVFGLLGLWAASAGRRGQSES